MTNKELIAELAKRLELTQAQTATVLEDAISVVSDNLSKNNMINVQGFGLFETKKKQERISVNPVTKQRFLIPPKLTPVFKAGPVVKEKLKKLLDNE